MSRRTLLAWAIGAGVGLTGGLLAALVPGHSSDSPAATAPPPHLAPPGDRVRAAIAGVEKDHLYVAPEVRADLTAPQLTKLRGILAKAPVPTYVVYWAGYEEARYGGYDIDADALDQLAAGVGKEGYYAVAPTDGLVEAKAIGYDDPIPDADDVKGRPYQALTRYLNALVKVTPERPAPPSKDTADDYWGGPGSGFFAGLFIAVPLFFVLMILVAFAGWLRRVWSSA